MHALVGGVAHAFNNLLASTIGQLELAFTALPENSEAREDLRLALADARRMAELCHRTISRCGTGVFNQSRVDLRAVVERTAARLAPTVPPRVQFRCQPGAWPVCVCGDEQLLETMTADLIINAMEAIGQDGGTVSVAPFIVKADESFLLERVVKSSLPPGEYAAIEVSDTGYGMDEVIASKAFAPMFTTKGAGRGLGLAEVQGIVLIHGGAVALETHVGKGSTFTVLLPPVDDRRAPRPAGSPPPPVVPPPSRGTIMVVDDEDGIRRYAGRILQGMGFGTIMAADGPEALEKFREHADEVDLVLLDVFMPRMDGDDVLREMRRIRPELEAVLISGYQDAVLSDKFDRSALSAFLYKPFATADFVERVEKATRKTRERKLA
jgi:two-component system, cell cycle sensor histidine kinase and response regulator CckA